jgi:hypothetical protein
MDSFSKERRRLCALGIVAVSISSGCGGDGNSGTQHAAGGSATVGGTGNATGGSNMGGSSAVGNDGPGGRGASGAAGNGTAGLGTGGGGGGTPAGGAGGGGTGSGVDTGLDPTTVVNKLSPADAQKICDAEARYVAMKIKDTDAVRLGCVLFASISGGGAAPSMSACEASVMDCLSGGMVTTMMNCTLDAAALASCTATIEEVETCATAAVDSIAALVSSIDCSIYSLPMAEWQAKLAALEQLPTACTTLNQKCPGAVTMGP